jgi:hypothetical protein
MKQYRITLACLGLMLAGVLQAQTDPGLPTDQGRELYGLNSFGAPTLVPGIHSEQLPLPQLEEPELLFPPFPRRYIVIRLYGIRPWFIHPYNGIRIEIPPRS